MMWTNGTINPETFPVWRAVLGRCYFVFYLFFIFSAHCFCSLKKMAHAQFLGEETWLHFYTYMSSFHDISRKHDLYLIIMQGETNIHANKHVHTDIHNFIHTFYVAVLEGRPPPCQSAWYFVDVSINNWRHSHYEYPWGVHRAKIEMNLPNPVTQVTLPGNLGDNPAANVSSPTWPKTSIKDLPAWYLYFSFRRLRRQKLADNNSASGHHVSSTGYTAPG